MERQPASLSIGMICPYSFDEPGGVQIHAIELCAELRRRGHRVSLIGPGTRSTSPEDFTAGLPDFVVLGGASIPIRYNGSVARLSFGPRSLRRVRRWIRRGNFDLVHIHEPNSPSYSMLALTKIIGPVVATYHASASQSRMLAIALPILRPLLERIHAGIAVSEEARRWQVENLAGDPVLIPNGVDTSRYRSAAAAAPVRTGSRQRIMFLGRLDESRKGLPVLLRALPAIIAAHPTVEVLIAGGGDIAALRSTLSDAGIAHTEVGLDAPIDASTTVRILGRVSDEDKARALAQSDVYIAPNTGGESFGIVLVEAMAAGTAVVASDIAAFRAVGLNGEAAALFRNDDARDLARVVSALLSDAPRREQLAAAGVERAADFDWSTVATSVEKVYHAVAVEGKKVRVR